MRPTLVVTALLAVFVTACEAPQSPVASPGVSFDRAASGGYEITDLGTLGGDFSEALYISNSGQIVGFSYLASGAQHPFIWQNGTTTDMDVGGRLLSVTGVNDRGQVSGNAFSDHQYAWQWQDGVLTELPGSASALNNAGQIAGTNTTAYVSTGGVIQDLGTLGGSFSRATDINDRGQVVGWAERADHSLHPFLWDNGSMRDLGSFGGANNVVISDAGTVAGTGTDAAGRTHAFLWDGALHDLGTLPWAEGGVADINNRGQVVGTVFRGLEHYTFLWQDGVFTPLGSLPGGAWAAASRINNRGEIVGSSGTTDWVHGVVWRDGQTYDLGTLGGRRSSALDINAAGIVVGYSEDSTVDSFGNGKIHAVMWRPAQPVQEAAVARR